MSGSSRFAEEIAVRAHPRHASYEADPMPLQGIAIAVAVSVPIWAIVAALWVMR